MATDSGSSSSLSPRLTQSSKTVSTERSPRSTSPQTKNTDSSKNISLLGTAHDNADNHESEELSGSKKLLLSPRSAPLAALVQQLGIKRADDTVVPFEAPSATNESDTSTSTTHHFEKDDDWDDGPTSTRASLTGSNILILNVDKLPEPSALFDPTPRNDYTEAETAATSVDSAAPVDDAAASVASATPASEPAPTPVDAHGNFIHPLYILMSLLKLHIILLNFFRLNLLTHSLFFHSSGARTGSARHYFSSCDRNYSCCFIKRAICTAHRDIAVNLVTA